MRIKSNIFPQIIWNLMKYFLYLQRQKVTFGYPGRIPREGKALSILPILPILILATPLSAGSKTLSTLLHYFLPKVLFDYPGKFSAREQDLIDTTPRKRVSIYAHPSLFFKIIID